MKRQYVVTGYTFYGARRIWVPMQDYNGCVAPNLSIPSGSIRVSG